MSKPFNDTTNKSGLIQDCEEWANLGDGSISANQTLLKQFTVKLNDAFDEVLPVIYAANTKWQWDDSNHDDYPVATMALTTGQADYSFIEDENGNSIFEIYEAYVMQPDGTYKKLSPVDAQSDQNADSIFARNSSNVGTPTRYDKFSTSLFLDPVPNYSQAAGIRVVFSRSPSYFASDDTTKTSGIPAAFHKLLSLIASRDWLAIHKAENVTLLDEVKEQIRDRKAALTLHLNKRSKDEKPVMRARVESSR